MAGRDTYSALRMPADGEIGPIRRVRVELAIRCLRDTAADYRALARDQAWVNPKDAEASIEEAEAYEQTISRLEGLLS